MKTRRDRATAQEDGTSVEPDEQQAEQGGPLAGEQEPFALALIAAHELAVRDDVPFHALEELLFRRTGR